MASGSGSAVAQVVATYNVRDVGDDPAVELEVVTTQEDNGNINLDICGT